MFQLFKKHGVARLGADAAKDADLRAAVPSRAVKKSSVYNRVVADLSGLSPDALLAKVAASFRVKLPPTRRERRSLRRRGIAPDICKRKVRHVTKFGRNGSLALGLPLQCVRMPFV